jgi:GNAT superfamily N-acetyltransferase
MPQQSPVSSPIPESDGPARAGAIPFELHSAAALGLSLRPVSDSDSAFIVSLFFSVRAPEFAQLGWPEPVLRQFVGQQEQLQHLHYRAAYPDAEWLVVEQAGEPIGRIYVDEGEDSILLVDISLIPERRQQGLGTALISDLIDRSERGGKATLLSVAWDNPARRLYERLGFRPTDEGGAYAGMRRDSGRGRLPDT